jgi:hypothetical protein
MSAAGSAPPLRIRIGREHKRAADALCARWAATDGVFLEPTNDPFNPWTLEVPSASKVSRLLVAALAGLARDKDDSALAESATLLKARVEEVSRRRSPGSDDGDSTLSTVIPLLTLIDVDFASLALAAFSL